MQIEPHPGKEPIFASEFGDDFEVHVTFGQLGVRVLSLDSSDPPQPRAVPYLSPDQARDLAARLLYAADRLETF